MGKNIIKNKKGFSLAECTVALLLFSIIAACVLTVFSSSRNQIRNQNKQFKSDLLKNNIISAYQASSNYNNMANILNWETKEADDTSAVPISVDNGNGSIPVKVHFDKITVDGGYATFKAEEKKQDGTPAGTYKDIISFEGNYSNNRLSSPSDIPNDYYTETSITIPKEMVLEGQAHPVVEGITGTYDYTYTINESKVKFEMGSGTLEEDATDFDKYLLDNGLYLKCVKTRSRTILGLGYYDYYYRVYSAENNQPLNTYYCVTFETLQQAFLTFTTLFNFYDGEDLEDSHSYLNLAYATIKTYSGDSCPNVDDKYSRQEANATGHKYGDPKFTELNVTGYNFKTGNWYFAPWLAVHDKTQYQPTCTKYEPGRTYYEYIPKSEKASNIYYILKKDNVVEFFDTDSVNIFSFNKDEAKTNTALTNNTCNISKATTRTYNSDVYDVWYQKGNMPGKTVNKIVFNDTKKEITVKSNDNKEFIRFLYTNNSVYDSDKNSIKTGDYKEYFTVSGNTATIKAPDTVYFKCESFDGSYSIKINDETIFTSNAQNFEIIGAQPMTEGEVSYGMIGEPTSETTNAKTYYVSCVVGNSDTSLVAKITFCDMTKPKTVSGKTVEPMITIWSIKSVNIPSDIKTIATSTNAHLECSYRKG